MLIDLERRFLAGEEDALKAVPSPFFVAAIEIAELAIGALLADSAARAAARRVYLGRVRDFSRIIPFGEREADIFAELYVHLRRAGTPVGEHDIQIAATALAHGHAVMTANAAEFARIPNLSVLTPP